jgi:hypothetical protein
MLAICDQTQEEFHERAAEVEIFQSRGTSEMVAGPVSARLAATLIQKHILVIGASGQ